MRRSGLGGPIKPSTLKGDDAALVFAQELKNSKPKKAPKKKTIEEKEDYSAEEEGSPDEGDSSEDEGSAEDDEP